SITALPSIHRRSLKAAHKNTAMNGARLISALLLVAHLDHSSAIPQKLQQSANSSPDVHERVFNPIPHCNSIGEPFVPYVESCSKCDDCKEGYRLSPKTCVCHRLFRFNN
ncbi:unnamed protein product, partial [Meganyctiphanes norvegica]